MELFEAIEKRHSYRGGYKGDPVPRIDLAKIVEAGIRAPSGMNLQTTDFVIVDDAESVKKIAAMQKANKAVQDAKAFIMCIVEKNPKPAFDSHSFYLEDCSAAVENMLLAITSMGYASVWIDGWLRAENRVEIIGKLLNIPEDKKVQVLLPVGVPEEEGTQPKKNSFEDRVHFNQYWG